jgi:hypothetical protein
MSEPISPDSNRSALTRPIAILRNGKESSIRTIGGAIRFLTSDLKHLAETTEWQHAVDLLGLAHEDYSTHVELATRYVEHVYSNAATLRPQLAPANTR